ncbi:MULTISPECIES: type II secretion system F family protein [unclassified Roseitalea]|uniref:type II secretion system F family protein n=1 Tax=unclassified Roseitalea TaxID=2639107 RepID=UPI00273FCB6C|nr:MULTISPECIES: type II secretion system F family protein [unclassified Roseitalea]
MDTVTIYGAALVMFAALMGAYVVGERLVRERHDRSGLKRRLVIDAPERTSPTAAVERKQAAEIAGTAARRAADFYASSDPENVMRLRQMLIRAGYMNPDAVGKYFLARLAGVVAGLVLGGLGIFVAGLPPFSLNAVLIAGMLLIGGYLAPTLVVMRRTAQMALEYRTGFPDFMDLMIVCADAGLSLEASIERVSREIATTYPSLSRNLVLVSLELRAGRPIEDALKALSDRLALDEVRAFAMLLKQSKELGTSLSGTLKVFSDEMRHKRMSKAEEKAHALPAKMTIPVTMCILPVVLLMAIIPTIVRFAG